MHAYLSWSSLSISATATPQSRNLIIFTFVLLELVVDFSLVEDETLPVLKGTEPEPV